MAHAFLFVDDSALHHQMYRLIFSRGALAGSTLYHATNGREGYALLAQHPELTLVFLDLNMPEMNGLEVLARRAAERLHPQVPIVLVTTESTRGRRGAGASGRRLGLSPQAVPAGRRRAPGRPRAGRGRRRAA